MKRIALPLVIALLCLSLAACGRKAWPEPHTEKERFTVGKTAGAVSESGCLSISTRIRGAWRNAESVVLEIQPADSPEYCPGCPFAPTERITFHRDAAELIIRSGQVKLTYCPSEPHASYRFRLTVINSFRRLGPVLSREVIAESQ